MEITFYKVTDEKIKLSKNLGVGNKFNGVLRDDYNVVNPTIMFTSDVSGYNYAYVKEFDRYYFVDSVTCHRNSAWIVSFSEDVLMSFQQGIMAMSVRTKVGVNSNQYISGGYVLDVRKRHEVLYFNDVFVNKYNVLVTKHSDEEV